MPPPAPGGEAFLAADVGGTHVRVGLVRRAQGGNGIDVLAHRQYANAGTPGLDAILAGFLASLATPPPRRLVLAIAGHALEDGSLISANLPWPVSVPTLGARLGLDEVRAVNDFEAVAHAIAHTGHGGAHALRLSGPDSPGQGPVLVVGPGTGLGAALHIPHRGGGTVLATEAGQAALAVGTPRELDVLRVLMQGRSHVSSEHVLSGPGLLNLYAAVCTLHGVPPRHRLPSEVTHAAQTSDDAPARETLAMFCALLGSCVGDMALHYNAHGGVYLAGGILPHIRDTLLASTFTSRLLDKGPMRTVLARTPVFLLDHGHLGIIGAACWYLGLREANDA